MISGEYPEQNLQSRLRISAPPTRSGVGPALPLLLQNRRKAEFAVKMAKDVKRALLPA
jgi:hypothetical protein